MFDPLYRPISLFLLGSEVMLMFFAAVKMLLISEYELDTIDAWQLVSRYNRFQEFGKWFHFFTPILSLSPPITSVIVAAFSGLSALINFRCAANDDLRMHIERVQHEQQRIKNDGLIQILLYLCAAADAVVIIIQTRRRAKIYPIL
jgi:hypothetical protein